MNDGYWTPPIYSQPPSRAPTPARYLHTPVGVLVAPNPITNFLQETQNPNSFGAIQRHAYNQRAISVSSSTSSTTNNHEDASLEFLSTIDTENTRFRFSGRHFFITWSRIGDLPNSALDEKINTFGTKINCK
jgi:hypothetical protein